MHKNNSFSTFLVCQCIPLFNSSIIHYETGNLSNIYSMHGKYIAWLKLTGFVLDLSCHLF